MGFQSILLRFYVTMLDNDKKRPCAMTSLPGFRLSPE
jgi:hypothetical protein